MKTFNYHGFIVSISKFEGGFGYVADNGKHKMAEPNPEYSDTTFPTIKDAEEAAKESIFIYKVMRMFVALSGPEQAFIAYITKRIHEKEWTVDSKSDIIQQVLKAGGIRRR